MSHFLDNLTYFTRKRPETFSAGHGITTGESRDWERAYRSTPHGEPVELEAGSTK